MEHQEIDFDMLDFSQLEEIRFKYHVSKEDDTVGWIIGTLEFHNAFMYEILLEKTEEGWVSILAYAHEFERCK